MKTLTKSRFKIGLDCPNKLFYTRKDEYANLMAEDSFLEALAEGGFQVEELARLHYPDGHLLEGRDWDYEYLAKETAQLLEQENVVIYEAAFLYDHLFVRTDILVKKGNSIKLIEVKAKSFTPSEESLFYGKRGGLSGGLKPYLFDLAFQNHVLKLCNPQFEVSNYFMLTDKSKEAEIDGLNQLFRISKNANHRTGIIKSVNSLTEIGRSVLSEVNADDAVQDIQNDKYPYQEGLYFNDAIAKFKNWYLNDQYAHWPLKYGACKNCEFRTSEDSKDKKSGYEECFKKQKNWSDQMFLKPNIFEIWNFRGASKLFEEDKFFLEDLVEDDIGVSPGAEILSTSDRQWLQVEKSRSGDHTPYIEKKGLKEEMESWTFPLHFIDFETSAVALPFNKGMKPYEQIAFQFSHHKLHENGRIEHASEFISNAPGTFPNFEFVRALRVNLKNDNGTIFRFADHENTVLNQILVQLKKSSEPDKDLLIDFIKNITKSSGSSTEKWIGDRNMVDLRDVVKYYYYNPHTKGSNSIKAVLPASLESSKFLQNKYSKPLKEIDVSSKNFDSDHVWLKIEDNKVVSPYKMLPPLFDQWDEDTLDQTISDMESLADGGAALTAYAKIQYQDMDDSERNELTKGLLKYCELDTLAMVMIYEHLKELTH